MVKPGQHTTTPRQQDSARAQSHLNISAPRKNFRQYSGLRGQAAQTGSPRDCPQPPQHRPKARVAVGRGGAGLCCEGHPKHGPAIHEHRPMVSLGSPACNSKLVRTGTSMSCRRGETGGSSRSVRAAGLISAVYCSLVFQRAFTSPSLEAEVVFLSP